MQISHHGTDVTTTHRSFSILRELALADILSDWLVPVLCVALVDGEYIAPRRYPDVRMGENKLSNGLDGGTGEKETKNCHFIRRLLEGAIVNGNVLLIS